LADVIRCEMLFRFGDLGSVVCDWVVWGVTEGSLGSDLGSVGCDWVVWGVTVGSVGPDSG
jgi:hypothetical protein